MEGKVKQLPNRLPLLTLVFVIVGIQSSNAQLVHFSEEAFDKATFSQLPLLQARQVCLESLNEQLVRIAEVTSLTEHQREKLRTAGEVIFIDTLVTTRHSRVGFRLAILRETSGSNYP